MHELFMRIREKGAEDNLRQNLPFGQTKGSPQKVLNHGIMLKVTGVI